MMDQNINLDAPSESFRVSQGSFLYDDLIAIRGSI